MIPPFPKTIRGQINRFLFWLGGGYIWLETFEIMRETERIRRETREIENATLRDQVRREMEREYRR